MPSVPPLTSLLGPALVALGLAALLVVVIRSNLRARGSAAAGPVLDDELYVREDDADWAEPAQPAQPASAVQTAQTVPSAALQLRPDATLDLHSEARTDPGARLESLEDELRALRLEVSALTGALERGRTGRRRRRGTVLSTTTTAEQVLGDVIVPATATLPAPEVPAALDLDTTDRTDGVVHLDDLEEVLPSLTLPAETAAPVAHDAAHPFSMPAADPTPVSLAVPDPEPEPVLTLPAVPATPAAGVTPGAAWVVGETPHHSSVLDLAGTAGPVADAGLETSDLPPVVLAETVIPVEVAAPAVPLALGVAPDAASAGGWDALQLVTAAPAAAAWSTPVVPGPDAEPELRLEATTGTTGETTAPAGPAAPLDLPTLTRPLADTLDSLDHLAQYEPADASGGHGRHAGPAHHDAERAVEATAERPVAPLATAGYSEMSRELAASGRLRDAVLAQWAADLRLLAPLLGDRVPRLSRALQGISPSDPATMLGSARAVAVMLADQSLLGDVVGSLDSLDHLSRRRLVLAAQDGTTVPAREPQLPRADLTALEAVLVRSAEAGGDGGHVSVSLRWDLITHLVAGVDSRVVRALLRDALEPHERAAFDSELLAAAR